MFVVSLLSQKGGTGKSTLAIQLAVAAMLDGHTVIIIDLDPQGSAVMWGQIRGDAPPIVVSTTTTELPGLLKTAEQNGVTLAILDTPPKVEPEGEAHHAARVSDLALILCRPNVFDVKAIGATVKLAQVAGAPARIVFNQVPANSSQILKARRAVEVYNIPRSPCMVGNRIKFSHAALDGQSIQEFDPKEKGSSEINALYKYTLRELEEVTRETAA
ncbi:MAG: AAA family ATPase [Candidatus Poribacteria bacterium]|nr:AAA family ATPase [Candidatus Poribacteria bacterium]